MFRDALAKWRRRIEVVATRLDRVDVVVFTGILFTGIGVAGRFDFFTALIVVGVSVTLVGLWFSR